MHTRSWLLGLALLLVAAPAAWSDEWTRRYPVSGRAELSVRTDDGSVRVETGDRAEIEALVTTEGWRIGEGEVTLSESQTGNRVSIEVRVPQRWHAMNFSHRKVEVLVRLPREADVDVKTGDGSVTLEPLSGKVSVFTGDGHITAQGLRGDLRLHTSDGSIKASGLEGRLHADTGDGHMTIRGRFEVLDLRTGDGHIDADVERGSKVGESWTLRSGDGGIVLRVPDDLAADLEAHTGDGSIELESPLTVQGTISHSDVRGKLGAGGPPIRIHTGDGSIRVRPL